MSAYDDDWTVDFFDDPYTQLFPFPGAEQTADEVAGRSRTMKVTCWNCGSTSMAYEDWTWVTCWKCGALFSDKS